MKQIFRILPAFVLLFATVGASFATGNYLTQKGKPKAPPKPPVKPAQKPNNTDPTKGTVELAGDNGKVGKTYQLGEKDNELHFTLNSAMYAARFGTSETSYIAGAKKRLLVLDMTVQNPLKKTVNFYYSSFKLTCVSPEDENFVFSGQFLNANNKKAINQDLLPAQKVRFLAVLEIHPVGPVNKLVVMRGDAPILRYDLKEKVGKLESAFASPTSDMLDSVGAQSADLWAFNVNVIKAEYSVEKFRGVTPRDGQRWLFVTVEFTNLMAKPTSIGWQYYLPELFKGTQVAAIWSQNIYQEDSEQPFQTVEAEPGTKLVGRYQFMVPAGVKPTAVRISNKDLKRYFEVDLLKFFPKLND